VSRAWSLLMFVANLIVIGFAIEIMLHKIKERLTMSGKRYGRLRAEPIALVDFELQAMREDSTGEPREEWHEFTARPQSDAGDLAALSATGDDGLAQMNIVVKMIKKMVINSDGVPEQWQPTELTAPDPLPEDYEPKFRGPDGQLYPMDQAVKFTDPGVGSSRRRLMHLLFEDEATVDINDLSEMLKDMMGKAAGRPTTAPSRS
jgi:hypothetical protein